MARPRHSGNGFRLLLASGARRRLGRSESVSCVRLPEPADLTSLVPRTDLSGDRGWETARMAIIESDEYPSATFVRDPALATDRSPLAWCAGGEKRRISARSASSSRMVWPLVPCLMTRRGRSASALSCSRTVPVIAAGRCRPMSPSNFSASEWLPPPRAATAATRWPTSTSSGTRRESSRSVPRTACAAMGQDSGSFSSGSRTGRSGWAAGPSSQAALAACFFTRDRAMSWAEGCSACVMTVTRGPASPLTCHSARASPRRASARTVVAPSAGGCAAWSKAAASAGPSQAGGVPISRAALAALPRARPPFPRHSSAMASSGPSSPVS